MALLNGQTAEQIAKDIINKAVEPVIVEVDGVRGQELDELVRYKFSKKIYSKGEAWFKRNVDALRQEFLESVIESQYKQRQKQDAAQIEKDNMEYYKLLVSRGMSPTEALYEAGLAQKPSEPAKTAPEAETEETEDEESK